MRENLTVEDSQVSRDKEGCGLILLSPESLLELTEKVYSFDLSVRFTEEGTGTQVECRTAVGHD